jgi:hypothetical protein
MAFKTFAPGVLTSSDVNTFLMRQAVITCTSSTRPASPSEGMTIYETDTDSLLTYSGSAWENAAFIGAGDTYTPTLQSYGTGTDWAIGNGSITGFYLQFGRLVYATAFVTFGSTSTFGTKKLGIGGPKDFRGVGIQNLWVGNGKLNDVSLSNPYLLTLQMAGGGGSGVNRVDLFAHSVSATYALSDGVDSTTPFTWASGDTIVAAWMYEAIA